MKKLASAVVAGVATSTIAWGGIVNGGFESGNFTGWTVEYGTVTQTGPCEISVAWGATLPLGHPAPLVTDSNGPPAAGQPIDVDPYCGNFFARINDGNGGNHATRLRQSFDLTSADACPLPMVHHLDVTWGAILEDGGHCTTTDSSKQAWFTIEILVEGTSVSLTSFDASAAAAPGSGWISVGASTWYRTTAFSEPFYAAVGDTVEVILSVYDCSAGGHGGMAFLDCVELDCDMSCGPSAVASYRFDDLGNFGLDDSGNGHQGILGAAVPTASDCGQSLTFLPDNNAQDFHVPHSNALNILGGMTGMAMIRPMGQQSPDANPSCYQGTIFSKGGSYWFQLEQNNNAIEFQNEGSGTELASTPYPFCLDQWTHVAFVRASDGLTVQFYVNGQPVGGPHTLTLPAAPNTSPLMVGNYGFGDNPNDCEFNGQIDEIKIFNRALTPQEVLDVFRCSCPHGSCVGERMQQVCLPGQGGVIACPCGNPPAGGGLGCDNFGAGPADSGTLDASGVNSLALDTIVLEATGLNNTALTVFFAGSGAIHPTGLAHGAGVRCVTTSLRRLYTAAASGGTAIRPGIGDPSVSARSAALGVPISPGESRHYFAIYRDPAAGGPCGSTASTVNLTNAGTITWQP